VVRANGGSSISLARNAGAGDDDDILCQFVSTALVINPIEDSEVTCIDFELAVCPYGDDSEATARPRNTPAPAPITSKPTPIPTSSINSNDSSSAVVTKRFGAALAAMTVTLSFFGSL
jgi:hypothetical protein